MDFQTATDALARKVGHQELADELGVSLGSVRQARLDPDASSYRPPPAGWREAVATLARRRARELEELAERVDG